MCSPKMFLCIVGSAAIMFASPALAEDSAASTVTAAAPPTLAVESGQIIVTATRIKKPTGTNRHLLTDAQLGEQRGGEAIMITNQTLAAITQGNVLNGDFTAGDVSISDNALQGFNGVGNILINTGAQVSLQAGMNLTISLTDE
jgi:hypothetical protein